MAENTTPRGQPRPPAAAPCSPSAGSSPRASAVRPGRPRPPTSRGGRRAGGRRGRPRHVHPHPRADRGRTTSTTRRSAATSGTRHRGRPPRPPTTVVDASTCKPVKGALVEIWHCDAAGLYSGFGGGAASRTFLRGGQRTDAKGLARFTTIYPGWYPGRTVHIHVKVHVGGTVCTPASSTSTTPSTDTVYPQAPYRSRGARTTPERRGRDLPNGGSRSQVQLKADGSGGYVATVAMRISR